MGNPFEVVFDHLTIYGPGLLGASLAMAVRRRWPGTRLRFWARREEALEQCRRSPWCDEIATDPVEAACGADLAILCVPVAQIVELGQRIQDFPGFAGILSDVGSTKGTICANIPARGAGGSFFIGSHPMAGGEQSGMTAAREDLFQNRTCVICPQPNGDGKALQSLGNFWGCLGMRVVELDAMVHDHEIAKVSHLPHLVASALAATLWQQPHRETLCRLSGPGLRDAIRIAGGAPDLWEGIVMENRAAIGEALQPMLQQLQELAGALESGATDKLQTILEEGFKFQRLLSDIQSNPG